MTSQPVGSGSDNNAALLSIVNPKNFTDNPGLNSAIAQQPWPYGIPGK